MAKKLGLISPAQLWGKPLKSAAPQKAAEKKVTGKMTHDDEDVTDDDIDVDAELANADVEEDELHAIEAESEADVVDEVEEGDPDEEDADDDETDYEAEEGDVSDESEDAVEDGEEVVTAVADNEEEDGDVENPNLTGTVSMSEKMSLSDHIRAEITRRQKSGDSLRGKDILDSLAKRKIKVSAAQISQLLKKAGLGGKTRGKKAAAPAAAATESEKSRMAGKHAKREVTTATKPKGPAQFTAKRPAATGSFRVPMDQLKAAEAFVDACGGSFQSAERILTAAAQLSQTFSG